MPFFSSPDAARTEVGDPPAGEAPGGTPSPDGAAPEASAAAALSGAAEGVLLLGALAMLLVMFYQMYGAAGTLTAFAPLLAATIGAALLWPLGTHRGARALFIGGGLLMGCWMADVLSHVLLPFAAIYVLAFLLDPLVDWLQQRFGWPRWASAAVTTGLALGAVALFAVLIVPDLVGEFEHLGRRLVTASGRLGDVLASAPLVERLEDAGLVDAERLTAQAETALRDQAARLGENLPRAIERVAARLGSLLGTFVILAVLPAVLYYTIRDYPRIDHALTGLLPTMGGRRTYLVEVSKVMGHYLRGMLTLSAIAAVNVSVALVLLDVPFAVLIGLAAGALNMVPNFGALVTAVGGVLLAGVFGTAGDALTVLLVLLGQSLLEQSILSPKIMSHQVGVHPVLVLLSLFVFGYFFGLFGLLVAVPVTALVVTAYRANREQVVLEVSAEGGAPESEVPEDEPPAARGEPAQEGA